MDREAYRTAKFGSWERSLALDAQVMETGRAEGIPFAFDRIMRTPNTLDAHRLIALAGEQGVQGAVVEAFFRGYFTEGRDISNRQTLLDVAAGAGLDRGRADAVMGGEDGLAAIRAAEKESRRAGVRGVPFFIIDGGMALSGAQPPGAFLDAFDRLLTSAHGAARVCAAAPGGSPRC